MASKMEAMRRVSNLVRRENPEPFVIKSNAKTIPVGIVYFIGPEQGMVKIGFTTNLEERLRRLQCGSPVPLYVIASIGGQPATLEREYHARFRSARAHGEWFMRTIAVNEEIERLRQ